MTRITQIQLRNACHTAPRVQGFAIGANAGRYDGGMTGVPGMDEGAVYAAIGEEGFARLVRAFYAQVPGDDLLGPMYPAGDLQGAEQRLRDFLVGRFGGPPRYMEQRGHPRLRARHTPFRLDQSARDRWVALMDRALDTAGLPAEVVSLLRDFFHQTATFLRNA